MMAAPEALEAAESVPQLTPLQPVPESAQFTPLFCASFCTVAVKFWLPPVGTVAGVGDTVTTIAPAAAVIVMVAAADLVPSEIDVAVRDTAAGAGTFAGALYVTAAPDALELADSVPQAAPLQPVPDKAQFTPLFCVSFCTVAVKFWRPPVGTLTGVGDTLTTIAPGVAVIVMMAAADLVPSERDVAVRDTVAGVGTFAGAL